MKKLFTLLSVGLLTAFASQAMAQEYLIENSSGIGPKIGYYKAPDAEDGTMFIGVQSRTKGKYFGAEFSAEYRGEQGYTTTGGDVTVRQIPVTGSLMVFAPIAKNLSPYGLAGLGAYYTIYDYDDDFLNPDDDTEVNLGYHLGFGADIALSESAALNVDYRYLFLNGDDDITEKEFSGNVISAGLTFYF
ncbi:outer membrane protein [Gracilimonas mengyeensis]|uniref:Opacity protein n=1 Tax=Gracilimonas mengyeensis TaxID=1302730 RepID=A0A521C0X0_9BACT|nr:outer membrane beta-barrel protein [Gracilimonas mengyeensis]SMO53097.1 Opacity protein [Gracilimonas mengyeensis]